MTNIPRPPKEIDLPTILFNQPGFKPSYGKTSELEALRSNYRKGELTARLQRSGLFLMRSLMLGAEFTEDPEAKNYARNMTAMLSLGSSWHSFAEDRPDSQGYPIRSVRRRRLSLPNYTHLIAEDRPSASELHAGATMQLADCIMQANRAINVLRSGNSDQRELVSRRTGRMLGESALQTIGVSIGDQWQAAELGAHDTQVNLMLAGQKLVSDSVRLSEEIGVVGTLAMAADPRPNVLQELIWDTMPKALANSYDEMQKALIAV